MAKMATLDIWTAKTSSNTGYCQPRHLPVPEIAVRAFHITVNSPLLQLASSTVVWLYAGGVSLILHDV